MASLPSLSGSHDDLHIPAGPVQLEGALRLPHPARAIIVFAHGKGSGRDSPRNRYIARMLGDAGFATLLIDLLTHDERGSTDADHLGSDIGALSDRVVAVTDWLAWHPDTAALPVGYFGSGNGGGVVLVAAARRAGRVHAVVSRGGRPDLAGPHLAHIQAPTLLIIGEKDTPALDPNRRALAHLQVEKGLAIVPGATHFFEEPGTLERVAGLAVDWFMRNIRPAAADRSPALAPHPAGPSGKAS